MKKEEKLKHINELLKTASRWPGFNRDAVENFIEEAKFKIARICGEQNPYITEIDVFKNGKRSESGMITDWQEQITTTLKKIKFEIENASDISEMNNKILKLHCNKCNLETNHNVFTEKTEREIIPELIGSSYVNFWQDTTAQILKCGSCGEFAMRTYNIWSEDVPDFPELNVLVIPKRSLSSVKLPEAFQHVPSHIISIYKETVDSLTNEIYLLCAGGIRAILEAICIDKNIVGGTAPHGYTKSVQGKIYGLCENGFITKAHAEILVHHQYLGDKALHNLQKPSQGELQVATEIIAHTLSSIYELEAKGYELKKRKEERID